MLSTDDIDLVKRSQRSDRWIIQLSLISFLWGTWAYVDTRWEQWLGFSFRNTALTKPLGEVITTQGDVKRRAENEFSYFQSQPHDKIFAYDHIFTSQNSKTEINLTQDIHIGLDENTLIVLDEQVLKLKRGKAKIRLTNNAIFKIFMGHKTYSIQPKSTEAVFEIQTQSAKPITVSQGSGNINGEPYPPEEIKKKEEKKKASPIAQKPTPQPTRKPASPPKIKTPSKEPQKTTKDKLGAPKVDSGKFEL